MYGGTERSAHHEGTDGPTTKEPMAVAESDIVRAAPSPVVDRFGRRFRYVRLSVTDLCNLSCHYCNPAQGCASTHQHKLSWDDLDFLVDVSVNDLGAEAVRITGGEPLVRPGLAGFIRGIRRHAALSDVALTTNGVLLERMGPALRDAGVDRVNISLDTFDAERFADITRGGSLQRCLDGIEAARTLFRRVKINCVALKPTVIAELADFVRFSHDKRIEVRFIELMPIFDEKEYFHAHFISIDDLRHHLDELGFTLVPEGDGPAEGNTTGYGPATTYRVAGTEARIGFISQMSNTKCLSCNKLRLTSDGALKPCLLMPEEIDLLGPIHRRDRAAVGQAMRWQFMMRADRYDTAIAVGQPVGRGMQATGG
ncbi:MAG: 3,8-cyclase [Candidatus Sumerlaeota bacterium]|nr:3,8-cyclase [Candidatus Sumerlaeota bacterium]